MMGRRKMLVLLGPVLLGSCGDTAPNSAARSGAGEAPAAAAVNTGSVEAAGWQANPAGGVQGPRTMQSTGTTPRGGQRINSGSTLERTPPASL